MKKILTGILVILILTSCTASEEETATGPGRQLYFVVSERGEWTNILIVGCLRIDAGSDDYTQANCTTTDYYFTMINTQLTESDDYYTSESASDGTIINKYPAVPDLSVNRVYPEETVDINSLLNSKTLPEIVDESDFSALDLHVAEPGDLVAVWNNKSSETYDVYDAASQLNKLLPYDRIDHSENGKIYKMTYVSMYHIYYVNYDVEYADGTHLIDLVGNGQATPEQIALYENILAVEAQNIGMIAYGFDQEKLPHPEVDMSFVTSLYAKIDEAIATRP